MEDAETDKIQHYAVKHDTDRDGHTVHALACQNADASQRKEDCSDDEQVVQEMVIFGHANRFQVLPLVRSPLVGDREPVGVPGVQVLTPTTATNISMPAKKISNE